MISEAKAWFLGLGLVGISLQANATGIPVVDVANMTQTTISASENILQTAKQLEQYEEQINEYMDTVDHYQTQFDDMARNSLAPGVFYWDKANDLVNEILEVSDTIDDYVNEDGSLMDFLDKYQDVNWYRQSNCYQMGGCDEEYNELVSEGSSAQKKANDALFKGIEQQQTQLREDAEKLEELKVAIRTAEGRMEALQYANMLASQQSSYLLQLRALMIQMQTAMAAKFESEAAEKAMVQATNEAFLEGEFVPSTGKYY